MSFLLHFSDHGFSMFDLPISAWTHQIQTSSDSPHLLGLANPNHRHLKPEKLVNKFEIEQKFLFLIQWFHTADWTDKKPQQETTKIIPKFIFLESVFYYWIYELKLIPSESHGESFFILLLNLQITNFWRNVYLWRVSIINGRPWRMLYFIIARFSLVRFWLLLFIEAVSYDKFPSYLIYFNHHLLWCIDFSIIWAKLMRINKKHFLNLLLSSAK